MNATLKAKLVKIKSDLENFNQELQDDYDDHSDTWRDTEAGDIQQNEIDTIETALNELENAIS